MNPGVLAVLHLLRKPLDDPNRDSSINSRYLLRCIDVGDDRTDRLIGDLGQDLVSIMQQLQQGLPFLDELVRDLLEVVLQGLRHDLNRAARLLRRDGSEVENLSREWLVETTELTEIVLSADVDATLDHIIEYHGDLLHPPQALRPLLPVRALYKIMHH